LLEGTSAAVNGTGSVSINGVVLAAGRAAATGQASVGVAAAGLLSGAVAVAGTAAVAVSATVAATTAARVTVAGAGTVTVGSSVIVAANTAIGGVGSVAADSHMAARASTAISGVGKVTADSHVILASGQIHVIGEGTVTFDGRVPLSSEVQCVVQGHGSVNVRAALIMAAHDVLVPGFVSVTVAGDSRYPSARGERTTSVITQGRSVTANRRNSGRVVNSGSIRRVAVS
jgi:hypothetical protein